MKKPIRPYIIIALLYLVPLSFLSAGDPPRGADCDSGRDKTILGSEEMVFFAPFDESFSGRIDTGAEISSIHASNIVLFMRNEKNWVRFNSDHDGTERLYERPLESMIAVRQSNNQSPVHRPLVKLTIEIGTLKKDALFSLADRSRMTFPVLIGRNVLAGAALVDVSNSYLQGR